MTYASYNEIISLSKSLGFDTTNNADLIREYFFLTLIHSWKGKNAGSKAIYESSKFFNIWNRYQMDFFDSEQVGKTSFWETVDALLLLFQINNLYDFQNFVCKLCPWVIADWQAFESTFSHDDLSIGSKVAALALLLKYVGLSADYDNISSVDPQQFFEKDGFDSIWKNATTLSSEIFFSCWNAVFTHELRRCLWTGKKSRSNSSTPQVSTVGYGHRHS